MEKTAGHSGCRRYGGRIRPWQTARTAFGLHLCVREGEKLLDIGKAYSGLTDLEIRDLTNYFLAECSGREGAKLRVQPTVVLEVAFNNMQKSRRHESGFALRFPRIVRLRPDKTPADIDTLEAVKLIFERQNRFASGDPVVFNLYLGPG